MELPGLTKDDFKLELKGFVRPTSSRWQAADLSLIFFRHTLTISGNVPVSTLIPNTSSAIPSPSQATADQIPEADAAEPEEKFKVHERLHGRFEKGFVVPYGTEEKDISATIQHGLLRVRVAKVEGRGGFAKLVRVLSH